MAAQREEAPPADAVDYRWRLEKHLLDYFGGIRVDAIRIDTVERYIAAKLSEAERISKAADGKPEKEKVTDKQGRTFERPLQPLSPRSINMTVTLLGAILESAVERELITRNAARGRGRRVKETAPPRSYLESAEQITALLTAAGELDRKAAKDRMGHTDPALALRVYRQAMRRSDREKAALSALVEAGSDIEPSRDTAQIAALSGR